MKINKRLKQCLTKVGDPVLQAPCAWWDTPGVHSSLDLDVIVRVVYLELAYSIVCLLREGRLLRAMLSDFLFCSLKKVSQLDTCGKFWTRAVEFHISPVKTIKLILEGGCWK